MKMFIGRLPHGTTTQDLEAHFSEYGQLTDTYIPTPFRNFAFITFASTEDAKSCMRETHFLGVSLFMYYFFLVKLSEYPFQGKK